MRVNIQLASELKMSFLGVKLNLSSPVLGEMPTRIQLRLGDAWRPSEAYDSSIRMHFTHRKLLLINT